MVQQLTIPKDSVHLTDAINVASIQQSVNRYDFRRTDGSCIFVSYLDAFAASGSQQVQVHETLQAKAESLASLQEKRIKRLQDALVTERMQKYKDAKEALSLSLFSLYADRLMSMSEVVARAKISKWQFFAYLDVHPEYRQVDIDGFLNEAKDN